MHDRNGTALKVGDVVLLPATVTDVQSTDDYCNLTVESLYGRKPDGQHETMVINAATVVLHERLAAAPDIFEVAAAARAAGPGVPHS